MDRAIGTRRAVVGVALALAVVVGGGFAAGVLGVPGVAGVENRFGGVDDETTTVVTNLTVSNPNPIGVRLGGVTVNYTVDLNGVRLAGGSHEGVAVSTGNSTLTFRTAMANERIPAWWVAHIRDGERSDLVVRARVTAETLGRTVEVRPVDREVATDLLGSFASTERRPVNANQPVVSDPILYVEETRAAWGAVSEERTPMRLTFVIYNPKTTPFVLSSIGYDITMNGVAVGAGELEKGATIPGRSERTVEAVTAIRNEALDEWWVSHLERNQVTDFRIDFHAVVELPDGQEVRVPLDALTYTETIETDIFGNKAANPTGPGSPTTPAGDGGSTTTAESSTTAEPTTTDGATPTEGSTTETETTTQTTTETATETTTDGGILPDRAPASPPEAPTGS